MAIGDRVRVLAPEGGPVLTKQSMAAETDINQIVARHIAHKLPFYADGRASYGDFTGAVDYHTALNALVSAQEEFAKLPAAVRDHCENDPGEFLDMVMDPGRRDELVALGLVPEAIPASAPVVPAVPAAPAAPPVGPVVPPS